MDSVVDHLVFGAVSDRCDVGRQEHRQGAQVSAREWRGLRGRERDPGGEPLRPLAEAPRGGKHRRPLASAP